MNEISKRDELQKLLDSLRIVVSRNAKGGGFTVHSDSGVLFCYVRKTEREVTEIVADTIRSYAKTFHNVDLELELSEKPLTEIPREESRPEKVISPRLKHNDDDDCGCVFV